MTLVEYLNKNFTAQMLYEGSVESLQQHFMEHFGVTVKHESPWFLFKYYMLEAKWQQPITHECRGVILHLNPVEGVWRYASRPFDKFFNQHEGYCPLFEEKEFNARLADLTIVEKVDGTCIQLWWDRGNERWRISTLGMITTGTAQDSPLTFEELFWRVVGDLDTTILDTSYTYIFELWATENRILTKYPSDRAYLLVARHTEEGHYAPMQHLDALVEAWSLPQILRPLTTKLTDLGISSLGEALVWVEEQAHNAQLGEYPEGFVLYTEGVPICKLKNRTYVQAAHAVGGDLKHTRNVVIEAVVLGTLDDIMPFLTDGMKAFSDEVKQKYLAELMKVQNAFKELGGKEYNTQKEYALEVQRLVPKVFQGFFFQNKETIFSDPTQIPSLFDVWMRRHYEKFIKSWKGLEK